MSRHFLINGQNYVKGTGLFDPGCQERSRRTLCERVAEYLGRGDRATVFWDAPGGPSGAPTRERAMGIDMIFCRGAGGADKAIEDAVRDRADCQDEEVFVVSDDRELCGKARQLGASILSVSDVETALRRSREERSDRDPDEKPLPTSEDTEHWLRVFEPGDRTHPGNTGPADR